MVQYWTLLCCRSLYIMQSAQFFKDLLHHSKSCIALRTSACCNLRCASPLLSTRRLFRLREQRGQHPSRFLCNLQKRYSSTTIPSYKNSFPSKPASAPASQNDALPGPPNNPPSYELTFTCKPCGRRSSHSISKQGYHHGTVLITCSGCKNRHVISDHLNIFADRSFTIEDLMKQKGELVKRGSLGSNGDVEFWEDGTSSERLEERNKS